MVKYKQKHGKISKKRLYVHGTILKPWQQTFSPDGDIIKEAYWKFGYCFETNKYEL